MGGDTHLRINIQQANYVHTVQHLQRPQLAKQPFRERPPSHRPASTSTAAPFTPPRIPPAGRRAGNALERHETPTITAIFFIIHSCFCSCMWRWYILFPGFYSFMIRCLCCWCCCCWCSSWAVAVAAVAVLFFVLTAVAVGIGAVALPSSELCVPRQKNLF